MLQVAQVAVCSENTQTECNHHVEFVNVKAGGMYSSWQALKCQGACFANLCLAESTRYRGYCGVTTLVLVAITARGVGVGTVASC
jgi:hypothetical protein